MNDRVQKAQWYNIRKTVVYIGYYLTKEYQNKGIAVDAVKKMLELHPRERYFATVNSNNVRSNNLVKKLGFRPKGIVYEKNNTQV